LAAFTTAAPSRAGRNIRRLGIAVAIVVCLYSAGWFYVASKIEGVVGQFVKPADGASLSLTCDQLTSGGAAYMLRFGLGFTCARTAIEDRSRGTRLTAGPFEAMARVYDPGLVNLDLAGPASATLDDGTVIAAQWKTLRASLRARLSGLPDLKGLDRLSLQGELPNVTITPAGYEPLQFKAREGEFHTRQNNGDLDIAMIANDFEWRDGSGQPILPTLSTSTDFSLFAKANVLEGKPLVVRSMDGELRTFKIATPDGLYGEMSGPFKIDAKGRLNGRFRTTFEKIDLWDAKLRTIFPDAGDTISGLAALLKGLAKGKDRVTVNLDVVRGKISLSFLPLGEIPAL
jgi:hypothetical protein